eukprot:m.377347 g.377347  ORF g.377347 m.377347 type:complete len:535 (+) comp16705_c4_seq24:210-1814(+)
MAAKPPRPPPPTGQNGSPTTPKASDMKLSEKKRVELMTLVRDGKISPEKAVEAALQLEENLEKANKRAEKKRQEDLERMTPKARQQALKLDKQRSAETRTGKDKRAGGGGAAMYVSPPATPTAGAFSGVSDLPATQMRLPDEKRIEVMAMVKSGELTVDQAMVRIRMLEKALEEHEMQFRGYEPHRTTTFVKKSVQFSTEPAQVEYTHNKYDYDRLKPEDLDYDANRVDWEHESEEETRRQLEVRWAYMEEQLPEGQQCEERVAYVENEKRVAAIEAENAKARAARRQAEQDRIRRSKELRATAKLDAKLRTQIDELEVNAAALRAVLATLERLLAAERDVAELARSSCGSMMSSIDDDDDDDDGGGNSSRKRDRSPVREPDPDAERRGREERRQACLSAVQQRIGVGGYRGGYARELREVVMSECQATMNTSDRMVDWVMRVAVAEVKVLKFDPISDLKRKTAEFEEIVVAQQGTITALEQRTAELQVASLTQHNYISSMEQRASSDRKDIAVLKEAIGGMRNHIARLEETVT